MKRVDAIGFLLGLYTANISLLLKLMDCSSDILSKKVDHMLTVLAGMGVGFMLYAYCRFYRQLKLEGDPDRKLRNQSLILRIRTRVNNLFFLYPAAVILAWAFQVNFIQSPMPVGLIGLCSGTLLVVCSWFLFDKRLNNSVIK